MELKNYNVYFFVALLAGISVLIFSSLSGFYFWVAAGFSSRGAPVNLFPEIQRTT